MSVQRENMKMKINSKAFRMPPGKKIKLRQWPTTVKPFCSSKKLYQKLLGEHVEELSSPHNRRGKGTAGGFPFRT
jgi:hypothetical protein